MSRGPCVALVLVIAMAVSAEIPQMISYQGKVTDASGNPVADNTYTMRFAIYDAVTGGTLQWDSGDQSVDVAGGVFGVVLGEAPQPVLSLDFATDYWLLVTFSGTNQSPRQRLTSAGYAYMASGLVPGTEVSGSVNEGTHAILKCENTSPGGSTYGIKGRSSSTIGTGVEGFATATEGWTTGVAGETKAPEGAAVEGFAGAPSGPTYGGRFESFSTSGIGVCGWVSRTSGDNCGVYGRTSSSEGTGVHGASYATSGTTYGGLFTSASSAGVGVCGTAGALSGATHGVYGESSSPLGRGVGGRTTSSTGVCFGGRFESSSTAGAGVLGYATATSGTTYGVFGRSDSPSGFGVFYQGGIAGVGKMTSVVYTSKGPTGLGIHSSAGDWVEDFGEGQLVDGKCHIDLDPLFLETVTVDGANPLKVFVELEDERCLGIVVKRGLTGFDVVERQGGDSSSPFWYRVVAKRRGCENSRLDLCVAAEHGSRLFSWSGVEGTHADETAGERKTPEEITGHEAALKHDARRVAMENTSRPRSQRLGSRAESANDRSD